MRGHVDPLFARFLLAFFFPPEIHKMYRQIQFIKFEPDDAGTRNES